MVQRAGDNEGIERTVIDEKTLVKIMKRFLGSKAADPEITKFYRVEDGINYMATTLGSAAQIYLYNKFDKGTGEYYFRKPLPNDKFEQVDLIPELETIPDGKKKITRPTGRTLEYPDVSAMFNKYNLEEFQLIKIPVEDVDQFIGVHEAMSKAAKVGGNYNTAQLDVYRQDLQISLYDSSLKFVWDYHLPEVIDSSFTFDSYHYDFALMTAIFKSLKDLKVETIKMYVKDVESPILFVGRTTDYVLKFAINRKLTR